MENIFWQFPNYVDVTLSAIFVVLCVLAALYVIVTLLWGLLKLTLHATYDLKKDVMRLRV